MVSPRWNKVARDLWSHKARTLLVVLAIAVGISAFGSVFMTNDMLLLNMDTAFKLSKPSSISLILSEFDDSLISWISRQSGVAAVSGKQGQIAKFVLGTGLEENLSLTTVPDFDKMNLNLLVPKKGSWPPKIKELVLERTSLSPSLTRIGDKVTVKGAKGRTFELILTGTVYDNSAFPYMFTNILTGYVSQETMVYLGYGGNLNNLEIATSPEIITLSDAEKLTFELTENLKDRGIRVIGTQVSKPNQHWAVDNSKAFTAILSVMGVFSLILSGFLVVNTITALLSQQKKQIGIMKAIGGKNNQLLGLYVAMVGAYGFLALFVALPVGSAIGYLFVAMVMNFLNLDIYTFYLPLKVILMEIVAALVVPVAAAVIPIVQGINSSVRLAISEVQPARKTSLSERLLSRISGLPRTFLISLRNVFRKKGRLALTMGTLVIAGAVFISVINDRMAMYREMERILSMFSFEVSLEMDKGYNARSVVSRLKEIPQVTAVEGRTGTTARRIKPDGTKGDEFTLSGLSPETVFSTPVILTGRWLVNTDQHQVVLSSGYNRDNPDVHVGDLLPVTVGQDDFKLEVVGVIAMSSDEKLGFMKFETVAGMKKEPGLASTFMLKTSPNDQVTQDSVAKAAEDRLERGNVKVTAKQTRHQIFSGAAGQFDFMIFFLLAMAIMVAFVGGLGLAGTMSLNVMERTREIGIMRSIGANDRAIFLLVLTEGLFIGILSWILSLPISLPLTYGLGYAIGNAFFSRTLVFVVEPTGIFIWLVIVLVISVIASTLPSQRAAKMSISDTLAYE